MSKQISITMPEQLYKESCKQVKKLGFRSVQEFILDSHRKRVLSQKRYEEILYELKTKGTKLTQKEALNFLGKLSEKTS